MCLSSLETINRNYDHVYFSPHPDDVVLSCGGRIAAQTENGESVLVVTGFPLPSGKTDRLKDKALDVLLDFPRRIHEDGRAMECLGADCLRLDYPDGIFRYRYPLLRYSLRLGKNDKTLCKALTQDIDKVCGITVPERVYFPLGIGQHRDHQILFEVGKALSRKNDRNFLISFYEDVPYVFLPELLPFRLKWIGLQPDTFSRGNVTPTRRFTLAEMIKSYGNSLTQPTLQLADPLLKYAVLLPMVFCIHFVVRCLRPKMGVPSPARIHEEIFDCTAYNDRKMDSIFAYHSQVDMMFGHRENLRRAYANYVQDMGWAKDSYFERCWTIRNP